MLTIHSDIFVLISAKLDSFSLRNLLVTCKTFVSKIKDNNFSDCK